MGISERGGRGMGGLARCVAAALSLLAPQLLPLPARAEALPEPALKLMTMLWYAVEKKDFGPASRFDAVEFHLSDILRTPAYSDSIAAMRLRNPSIQVIGAISCDLNCTNYAGREEALFEWSDSMAANDWYLRDTDGDYWKMAGYETTCAEGWMNFTDMDMARAYAEFIHRKAFVENPGVFDAVHLDLLLPGMSWANNSRWIAGGVDSIDADRDGVADQRDSLDARWARGTEAFCARLRELTGDGHVLFPNGTVPSAARASMNGRFHEGFPGPVGGVGPDWHRSMFDPQIGYLTEPALYDPSPQHMITLQGLAYYPTDCDPSRLATTEDPPADVACVNNSLKLTVVSALLGDGYSCYTGWGRNAAGTPINYHTTWWFPLYDSLRVNLGTPLESYADSTAPGGYRAYSRWYSGGLVRVHHYPGSPMASPTIDLRPKAVFREPVPPVWEIGQTQTIRFRGWDPLPGIEFYKNRLLLSRDGGASYPETLDVEGRYDTLFVVTVPGPASPNCRVRVEARDYGNQKGWSDSDPFSIVGGTPTEGIAEAGPTARTAGAAGPLALHALVVAADAGGVAEMRAVRPATITAWTLGSVTVNGAPFAGTTAVAGDTVIVTPDSPWPTGTAVAVAFQATAQTQAASPGAAIAVYFASPGGGLASLGAGDADGVPGNGESLTITVAHAAASALDVSPTSATLAAGQAQIFSAAARDAYGNPIPTSPAWLATGGVGTITPSGVFTAGTAGSGAVVASAFGITDTAAVTVLLGGLARVAVAPDSARLSTDSTAQFSVTAFDSGGNAIAVSGVWSVTGAIGSISNAGLFTPSRSGLGSVRFTASGVFDSAGVTVVVGAPAAITVSPPAATIPADSSLLLAAVVTDAKGNARGDPVSWSVEGGVGAIDAGGRFRPGVLGSGLAIAASGALADTASLTVVPGSPIRVVVDPALDSIAVSEEASFTAQLFDTLGTILDSAPAWSVSGPLVLLEPGLVRGSAPGDGLVIVRAGSGADTARVHVTATPSGSSERAVSWTIPQGPLIASPGGRGDTLRVSVLVTRGGVPDSAATSEELSLLLAGGGVCAAETLHAAPDGPGAFLFETSRLSGCSDLEIALVGLGLPEPFVATVPIRSADQDGSGSVGMTDVALFLEPHHRGEGGCADLSGDGVSSADDVEFVASELGSACGGEGLILTKTGGASIGAADTAAGAWITFEGTREPAAGGEAPPDWEILEGTLAFHAPSGLSALYFGLAGEGLLLDFVPGVGNGVSSFQVAGGGDSLLALLFVEPVAPSSDSGFSLGSLRIALPGGAELASLEPNMIVVNGDYATELIPALVWDVAASPPDTGGGPPDSTGGPPDSTGAPDDSTGAPDDSTGAPDDSTGAPDDSTGAPDDSTGAPDDSTGAPDDSTGAPDDSTGSPPDSSGAPGDSTGSPPDSTGAPGDSTGTPPDSTGTPDDSTGSPPDTSGEHQPPGPPGDQDASLSSLRLLPPSPNPARGESRVRLRVPAGSAGRIQLSVYDAAGRLVEVLHDGTVGSGEREFRWDGRDWRGLPTGSGIYFFRLVGPGYSETQRSVRIE